MLRIVTKKNNYNNKIAYVENSDEKNNNKKTYFENSDKKTSTTKK